MRPLDPLPEEDRPRILLMGLPSEWAREAATALQEITSDVRVAADAYAAVRLTQARPAWDLVAIQLDAPGMNGFEFYSRLRDAVGGRLPVVFLTTRPEGRSVQVAAGDPPVELTAWPLPVADFVAAVRRRLGPAPS